jgi:hypothetical protein
MIISPAVAIALNALGTGVSFAVSPENKFITYNDGTILDLSFFKPEELENFNRLDSSRQNVVLYAILDRCPAYNSGSTEVESESVTQTEVVALTEDAAPTPDSDTTEIVEPESTEVESDSKSDVVTPEV